VAHVAAEERVEPVRVAEGPRRHGVVGLGAEVEVIRELAPQLLGRGRARGREVVDLVQPVLSLAQLLVGLEGGI